MTIKNNFFMFKISFPTFRYSDVPQSCSHSLPQCIRYQSPDHAKVGFFVHWTDINFYERLGLKLSGFFSIVIYAKNDIFVRFFDMDNIMRWKGIMESWKITLTRWSYHWFILDCVVSFFFKIFLKRLCS